ncbi:uncharacterized protein [Diadema setosum]|uniref:uncharacterized protein n=1 Tax=Diadema setosum TaxID=31175 RepID=UPI003B3B7793
MGVVSQVGLLLWKNLKLMIRNPLLAITQFFWPILIFVVIALVRNRVPPSPQTECHYNPQALPSVGTVDFMQSMMCDIESSCRSENIVPRSNEPPVFGASIGTLLDDLSPLLENGSTIESFQSLPSALAPLVNLTETLEETLELIREQNFYVKDFLLNETRLKEEISNKISRENAGEIIGSLLEARIDLLELLDILGYGFSTSVFCNATMLEAYVLFPEGTDVEEIVEVLCGLDNSELEGLLAIILEEVDTRYIAEEVTAFLNAVEKYGLGNFTRDVLDLQERLADIADLGDFVDVLPQLLELARFIPDIQRFVEIIQGGSPQDILSSILDSLGIIREILDRQPGDIEWLETTKQILSVLTDLVSFLQDLLTGNVPAVGEIPFDDLLDGSNIEHLLGELNINSSIIADFLNSRISLERLAAFADLLRNPDSLVRAYCHGNVSLEPLFSLPQGLDDTVLRGALCKGNTTRLLEAVLEELAELQHGFVFDLNGILGPLLNQTGQLGELFDDLPPFLRDFLLGFNTTQLDQLSPIFDLIGLFSNQTGADGFMDLLGDALAVMEGMFMQSTWWDEVRRQLAIQSVLLDAQISLWQNIHDGTFLEPLLLNPYSEAIELLLQLGPNVTEAVLSTFINPAKIEELMDLPPGELALVFCSDFIEYPAGLDVTYAQEQLCKLSVNATWLDGVLYIGASLFPDVAHAIETYFVLTTANVSSPALSHYFENATFRNILHKQQELQDAIWAALSQPIDLGAHFADLDLNITGTPDEWLAMLMRLQQAAAPQLQSNFLMGQFESIFESLEEIPEVQKLYAFQLAQDVMVQDATIILHAVNSLAYGEVPMYGGEIEKFLEGVVFLTQRGGAIQAAIAEAYEDPAKVLALADINDSVMLLCNATLRQSLLELPEEDSQALDSTLCGVDYGLLGVEFMDLMQVEELQYLLNCAFHAEFNCSEPLYWNVTASTVLYTELLGQVELLGPALEKWALVFNQTGLMAFLPALAPAQMADAWNMPCNQSQRLMQVTDWQAAFCNATLRDALFGFTDKGVDASLFEQTFCRTDWDTIAQELSVFVDAESITFWLEQVQNASTKPLFSEFDWEAQTAEQNLLAANLAGSWELMEAFAVQLNLSHVIAHGEELLTKYLIDQFGLTTGNDTDWSKELTTQLMDTWLLIDGQLSSLPGWGVYKANVYLLFATVEQLVSGNATLDTPEISLAMLVPNATELALVLSDTLALPVDVVYQLIMMPIDPSKLIEVVTTNSWNETLCGQGLLPLDLELPAGLNLTQLQRALCEVDFEDLIARLSRGEGIDHFISLLIAELRAFHISDDLTGWVSEFERILESLDLTSVQGFLDSFGKEFSTLVDNIDRMFVNATPGWDAFVANLDIITTVLQYTTPLWNRTEAIEPITLASLVPDADQLVEVLTPLAPLNPEIILAIINAEINPQALLEMAISGQWNETLCSEEALKLFFVSPESLNLTLIHGVLCSLDFQQSLTELMQDSAFQMIWSMIVDQLYLSIIPDFTIPGLDLQTLLPQIFTFVETLNPADLQNLEGLQALFVNETWYQETIKQLQWMTALNRILSDKLIMLEGQEIIFPYLGNLLADAPELQRILLQDYQIAPGLVEAIFSLSLQPDKMLVFFNMTNPLLTLCASGQFSAFFYSPLNPDFDVASLETAFCSINFEDLTIELKEISSYDEILAQYQLLIDPTVQVGTFNWTAYALSQEEWTATIQRLIAAPPSLTFDPAWQNKTVANLLALAERLNAAQQRLISADGMENLANLAALLESGLLNNQPWALELEAALRTMNAIVAYSNDYLLRLPGRNITLNDLMPPYTATYLETNSDLAPDVITLLLHASVNTEAILARQGNRTWLETVCADIEDLPQLIEIPADIDLEAAHQALCSLDVEAFQLAYLQDLQEVIAEISSGNAVNFTALSQNFQTLAFAIQSLIENPPNLLKYNEEWFATTLGRIAAVLEANSVNNTALTDPEFLSFVFADILRQIPTELLNSEPALLVPFRLSDYITSVLIDMLKMLQGQSFTLPTLDELFVNATHVRELLGQSDVAPEIIDTFLSLSMQADKMTYLFVTPNAFAQLCASGEFATFFTLPPDSPTDISVVEEVFCSTNVTVLLSELDDVLKFTDIQNEINRILSLDPTLPPFNQTAAMLRQQELAALITAFIVDPPQVVVDPAWWLTVSNRTEVILAQWLARLAEQSMSPDTIPGLDRLALQFLEPFQVPGLNETWVQNWLAQVQLMEYVNDVLTQWIMNANGTAMPVPTFGELFPDPTILTDLLRQLGLPEDMITAFLDSAIQADQWNQVWMSEDPLKTLCEAGLLRDTIAVAINSSVTAQAIQDSICSVNLTDVDDLLSSIFDLDALIIEVSRILFNDPTLDWEAALNLSRQLSENLQQLLASPPTTAEDIEQISLSLVDGLEDILRMFGVWDKVRPYLSLTEVILGTAEHYLDITDDIIRTVLDPQAPLEDVTRYLNLTQEEIRIALLGDFIYLTYLADYYQSGQLDTLVCQEGYYNGVHLILRFNVGFINQTALQQYLCSADLQEFFADAKDLYGFDFLRWAEVSGSIFQDLKANHTVDSFADIASLVLDLTAMVQDLAALPEMLTGDIDVYTLITRVTSLSTALQAQEMELIIKSLEELEPFLNDPYVIGEIRTALMSGVALMQWSSNLPTDLDPVAWLQSAQEALVETGLWQQVLPIVNFVDLLIEGQLDSLMPLGFSLPHLLTNETVLNKFLTEALDMAPEYAEALLLSEINPIMTLAELHLSGEWEEVFCADVPQMMNSSEAEVYQVFNVSAVFSHLCHLNRTQFFEHVNSLLSIDILRLTEEFANLLNHSQTGPGSGQLYDWQSLVSNVQAIIDTYKTLFELDTFNPNVNHTQIEELLMRLQHGLNTFDVEVLFESMELLNNLLYLDGEWDQIKGYMNTVTSIVEWMNDQLDNIDAHNISLFEAITHHEMVLQNLYVTVYPEDFAILATSTVNTEIANSLQTHEDFERVLCDPAAFNMLLTPVFNASLETLQGTLCAALLAGHETLVDDLQTHFITAPLQQDLIVLATNNHNHGFVDQDLDMRHMINEIQELGDGLANSLMKEFSAVEPSWTVEEVVYEVMTGFNESVIMKMVFDAVAPTIMNLTIWSDYLHPIIGRLDLGMRMVDDLYFTLPERVGEINAILNDTALLTPAVEVIMVEAPVAVAAWNDISGKAGDLLVTGGVLLRLLTGELQGVSSDPARLEQLLVDIGVEAEETSVDEFIVSLDKILLTDFVQELMAAFKIPENTQRLAIILDWSSTDDLPAWDVGFLERSTYFVRRVSMCYWDHTLCPAIDLELGQTLQLFASLIEIVDELQKQNLENLFDLFELIQPLLDGSLGHLNVSSDLEQTLSDVLDFLVTVYQDGMVDFSGVLPLLDFDEAFMNSSIVLQFLRENLGLTDLDLAHLRDGTLNTTLLLELLDMSSVDTAALLCRNSFVDDLLGNVDSQVVDHLVQGLCSNGSLIAVEFLRDNLDVETIIELINSDLQQTFPEFVLDLLGALSSVQRIDFTELGDFAVNVLLPIIQQGSVDFSDLEALGANINMTRRILESFDQVLTSFEGVLGGWPPFKDIQDLVRTLLDKLYIFEILGEIPDLSVDKILENPDRVRDYLVNRLDLSPETADNLMKAELNLEQLLESDFSEFLEELCGEMYLERILILPNQTDAAVVADTLCSLNGQELAILIELFIPYVDINGIIEKAESAQDLTGMIGVSNRTIVQVIQSMDSLQSVTKALPALESALSDLSEDPALERLQDLAQLDYLTGEEISVITQEIVCGRSSLRRRRRSADEVLERSKRTTISDNDDNFCQNIFSSIVNGINGQLVWAYLKPIVEGLILYSPDTEPVRRIITEANKTFADVAMVQEFAQIWLSSEEDLTKLLDPAALDATRTLLENSFVSGLLEAEYGIVSSDFTDLLDGDLTTITQSEIDTLTLLAELVNNLTTCFNLDRFVGYSTEEEMVEAARGLDQQNTLLAALAFDIPADATEIPRHIVYKIRMDTDNTPPTDRISNRNNARGPIMDFVFDLRYLRGFIMLQDMVERGIIALQAAAGVQTPGVYLQPIPYPCHQSDLFTFAFAIVLPLIVTVSFVILIGAMTHQLVYEKERGIEELMKAMGMAGGANWWAWFISSSVVLAILAGILVLIMKVSNILPLIQWTLLLVFFLDFFFSIIMYCYLASAIFQRANLAALASILVYLMMYLPYLGVFASDTFLQELWEAILLGLFSPSTFSMGCFLISQFESLGTPAGWDNLWVNPLDQEVTSMALVLILLACDGALYFLLGWYIKTLFPGKYGVPRPWYFPLQPSYWCRCYCSSKRDMTYYINSAFTAESGVTPTGKGSAVEEEPSTLPLGVAIKNLTKIYRSCCRDEKVAVDNLTLNFFEGQVTALLGHNGAGKTTTINIITGLFSASSGEVLLQGLDIAKKIRATRKNLGVCVQHNALYEDLTVREHMVMAGRVKGLSGRKLDDDIYDLLEDVGLLKKSEQRVKNLSGGMKRKLSVAMALVGDSKVVILDEPTSGVDPHARRAIWNLIMKHKTGRTIILCTHFMDEADILGDRIAILDRGHLRCCGSPGFLKSSFSSGYRLSLAKEVPSTNSTPTSVRKGGRDVAATPDDKVNRGAVPNIYDTMKRDEESDRASSSSGIATDPGSLCDTSQVTEFIKTRIPSAQLQEDIGTELIFSLPVDNGERQRFQELFWDLDENMASLHVKSYGISDTTLKEVFLKVSTERSREGAVSEPAGTENWTVRSSATGEFQLSTGVSKADNAFVLEPTALQKVWGLIVKRLHFIRRDWRGFIWSVLMPVTLVALAVGFAQLSENAREVELQLTPTMFNKPDSYVFFSHESSSPVGEKLLNAFLDPPGLGTTCLEDSVQMNSYSCDDSESDSYNFTGIYAPELAVVPPNQCNCTTSGIGVECSANAGGVAPPQFLTDLGIYLQDITPKRNKNMYLVDTQLEYQDSRYGGVSWFDVQGDDQTTTQAWFNNRGIHAMPTFLNVMNNIILRATVDANASEFGITAYNHPLSLSKEDLGTNVWLEAGELFGITLIIVAAFALIPSAFAMFLIDENLNGSKRLHYVSGVGTFAYWSTNLLWDMLIYCIPVGLIMAVLKIFEYGSLISLTNIGPFASLALLYGFAMLCQIYLFISLFKNAGTAFIVLFCSILLSAVVTNMPNWLIALETLSEEDEEILGYLNWAFLAFTPFCLSSGLLDLIQNQITADIYGAFGVDEGVYQDPFELLKWKLVALAAEGALAFLLLLIVDGIQNSSISSCIDPSCKTTPTYQNNEDVMDERSRVLTGGSANDLVTMADIRKVYRGPARKKIVAVNDLCLGVPKGECFGLLGVNGAGKTTTFRMITRDLAPTSGSIKNRALSVGYCPQENAMYQQLTGRELLYCYARIKGIPSKHTKQAVADITMELGMESYIKKRISTYSGGMKRSLAVAVALLGRPDIVLMDEPTTGMDPITKQRVLNSIVNVVKDNRSVILTSHSMEECEAVCTRLAIMVNGHFCCLGSPQHVRHRHGNGYSLVVRGQKSSKTDMPVIIETVHQKFPGAELKEHHHNMARFQLPPQNTTVASIFGVMEQEQGALNLEDYSVTQTTLDDVFVNFAKQQTDGLEDDTDSQVSVGEVSIINRAFEPDIEVATDTLPRNKQADMTKL